MFIALATVFGLATAASAQEVFPGVSQRVRDMIAKGEVPGAITVVADESKLLHFDCAGVRDVAAGTRMQPDTIFWIASMTKPVTGVAVMMLLEEGKLQLDDVVSKYIPELEGLKTADGKTVVITLRHLLTHTSGLSEPTREENARARTLAELIPFFASKPLAFKPGTKWQYSQSGINSLGRVVEIVSGQSFPEFLEQRLFAPLGMKDTTFYPTAEQAKRLAKAYKCSGASSLKTAGGC
jgi:CubicO group peptidase (beta-lactamase class C family)